MDTANHGAAPSLTLGRKLLIVVLTFTGLFIANFLAYNYLLRELDRTATAVDAAGRQRMLSQKIAYTAFMVGAGHADREALKELTAEFHQTLEAFKHGGSSRNFVLNAAPARIAALLKTEEAEWTPYREAALRILEAPAGGAAQKKENDYIESHSEALLSACEAVTAAFRDTAEAATSSMNQLMLLLIALGLLSGTIFFYFVKKRITTPLAVLDKAAAEITAGHFPELEAETSGDEVGNLFKTFATMSWTISRDVKKRSAISSLLAISMEHGSMAELLGKFLEHLLSLPWLDLEAKGAIFLADAGARNLAMTAQRGMPGGLGGVCANVPSGHCLCGRAAASGRTVFAADLDERHEISYEGMTPHGHYCLPIKIQDKVIGVLNLYVGAGHKYDEREQAFLESACAIIAKAVDYKNLEAKAYQAQKMESLGKAVGAVAHDFNNILTGMKGFNELAQESLPSGSEAARYTRETAAGIDKGADLVRQLLAFSRKQPAEMTSLDLSAVAEGMRTMLGVILEKKIRVKFSLAPGLPRITANKGQLEQVLVNLAMNARDAILPKGGELSITTAEISLENAGPCAAELGNDQKVVKLTVSDTGSGMAGEVIEHVFEPFFTTKPEGRGTGLGLSTVYSIVKLHKGGINIISSPGKGSTFEICFPANP